jgi:TPR repeat protein
MNLAEALQLLELSEPFTKKDLKTAYRQALMVWHPDRFTGNDELRRKAETRLYALAEAYDYLRRALGTDDEFSAASARQSKSESEKSPERQTTGAHWSSNAESQPVRMSDPPAMATSKRTDQRGAAVPYKSEATGAFTTKQKAIGGRWSSRRKWTKTTIVCAFLMAVGVTVIFVDAYNKCPPALYAHGARYANGYGVAQDGVEAVKWYRKAAEGGFAEAQNQMARCYWWGSGVKKDNNEVAKWYRRSAEQGNAVGEAGLARCYWVAIGVERNLAEALVWYRKSAELGNADAQSSLAYFYRFGVSIKKDEAEAAELDEKAFASYHAAAIQGDVDAEARLASEYWHSSTGIPTDEIEAVKWYRKAEIGYRKLAENGDIEAQWKLACIYDKGGHPKMQNQSEAVRWLTRAAEQGMTEAQRLLADRYYSGDGVAKNHVESVKWWLALAASGDRDAQYRLGVCFHNGEGVPENAAEAVKWYEKSAQQGYAQAQFVLGICYYFGAGELTQDNDQAVEWFRKASDQGDAEAQNRLGICYMTGNGVAKNLHEAEQWFQIGATRGLIAAQTNLAYCRAAMKFESDSIDSWFREKDREGVADSKTLSSLQEIKIFPNIQVPKSGPSRTPAEHQ